MEVREPACFYYSLNQMQYLGEIISLGVACSWTIAALSSEVGSRHLGVFVMNVWRMGLALLFSCLLMWVATGHPLPVHADARAWGWLLASGVVGYFFGDWCLFNSYLTIGSRTGQLFMTLAPAFAAVFAFLLLHQTLGWHSILAIIVTLTGIAVSVFEPCPTLHTSNSTSHVLHPSLHLALPRKGVLFGLGAGLGQGLGLVLSKIGLDYYTAAVPSAELPSIEGFLPFGANLIRCIAGLVCFSLWLIVRGEGSGMRRSLHDRRGLLAMLIAVFSGPFVGVGFSLMAVQYTAAGIASTLMALTPILILIPSRYLFGQPITARSVVGAVISCIGVSLFFLL